MKEIKTVKYCDECLHRSVCTYKEVTERICENLLTDYKHFPPNLQFDIKCSHRHIREKHDNGLASAGATMLREEY